MMAHSMAVDLNAMAERSAGRLCRQNQSHLLDREDVRQDLLVDLLCRLHAYDDRRGPWRPFVLMCFQHRSSRLLQAARREHLNRHSARSGAPVSEQSSVELVDTLAEADGYGVWTGQWCDTVAQHETRFDLARVLATMPNGLVFLCGILMQPERDPVHDFGLSRTTLHRRVRELRCQLLAAGIGLHHETSCRTRG